MAHNLKTDHTLSIKDKNNHSWAVLTFRSRAQASSNIPRFLTSDQVEGMVKLNLDSPKRIKKLTVELLGFIAEDRVATEDGMATRFIDPDKDVEIAEKSPQFLENVEILIPDAKESSIVSSSSSGVFKIFKFEIGDDKIETLTGEHSFPFSINLPPTIAVTKGHFATRDHTYDLPPSFLQRGFEISVNYELRVKAIVSFTLGSTEHGDKTLLDVHNARLPPPLPVSFKLALENHHAFPGPIQAPEAWWVSEPIASSIERNNGKAFVLTSKLAVPQTLCFTLRDTVPLRLSIRGDREILETLSDGSAIRICLVQNLSRDKKKPASEHHGIDSDPENHTTCVKCASVWPVESKDAGQLEFLAEVTLDSTLHTSFDFVKPSVAYNIVLLPYQITGLKEASKTPIIVQNIGILGYRAAGSQPWKSYAPSNAITPAIPHREGWYDSNNDGTLEMVLTSWGR